MSQTESNNQSFIYLLTTVQPRGKKESNVPFFPQRTAWARVRWIHWGREGGAGGGGWEEVKGRMVVSLLKNPEQKALTSLWTSEAWGGKGGRARNGKVLNQSTEKYLRSQIRRALNGSPWARNKNALWLGLKDHTYNFGLELDSSATILLTSLLPSNF